MKGWHWVILGIVVVALFWILTHRKRTRADIMKRMAQIDVEMTTASPERQAELQAELDRLNEEWKSAS